MTQIIKNFLPFLFIFCMAENPQSSIELTPSSTEIKKPTFNYRYEGTKQRLTIYTDPSQIFNKATISHATEKYLIFTIEERDFIKKYIADFLGSIRVVKKFLNLQSGEIIYSITSSDLEKYQFNSDESRFVALATKRDFFNNSIQYCQLIDTKTGDLLLSKDNVTSVTFVKEEGMPEELIVTMKNGIKERYNPQTGKSMYEERMEKKKELFKTLSPEEKKEIEEEESVLKHPSFWENIRNITSKNTLRNFIENIRNKFRSTSSK